MFHCSFLLLQEIQTSRVQECKFFSYTDKDKVFGGFAVMTCNMEFYIIVDIDKGKDEVRVKKLAALPGTCYISLCSPSHCYYERGSSPIMKNEPSVHVQCIKTIIVV